MALYIPSQHFPFGAAFVCQAGNFWTLLCICVCVNIQLMHEMLIMYNWWIFQVYYVFSLILLPLLYGSHWVLPSVFVTNNMTSIRTCKTTFLYILMFACLDKIFWTNGARHYPNSIFSQFLREAKRSVINAYVNMWAVQFGGRKDGYIREYQRSTEYTACQWQLMWNTHGVL